MRKHLSFFSPQRRREPETRFEDLFFQAAVGMALARLDGRFVEVNPQLCAITGYSEAELLARSSRDLTHPDDRAAFEQHLQALLAGQVPDVCVEKRYLRRDGQPTWVSVTVSLLRDQEGRPRYLGGVVHCIDRQKALARQAAESQRLLEGFFRQAAVGMAVVEADGHLRRVNRRFAEIVGYARDELKHMTFQQFTHPDDLQENLELHRALWAGEVGEYAMEKRYIRKDGEPVWCLLSSALVRSGTDVPFVCSVVKDITERKRLEVEVQAAKYELELRVEERTRELRLAWQQAEEALRAAEAANRMKSEFLATMSHEIRTPLNGVLGFNGLLLDSLLDEDQRRYAELARQSGESLLHLLNDFLDYSKIEAGYLELEPVDFDPHLEIDQVVSLVEPGAREKGLELRRNIEAPHHLRGDVARLRQVLLNLLGNAVKFTERGHVTLRCEEVSRQGRTVWLRFEVADTGIGIEPASQEKIFQPFTQADASTTRRYGGTGLGLAISRRLAEALGGRIGLHSVAGEGSTFWLELPLQIQPVDGLFETARGASAGMPEGGFHGRILVVEDNPVSQQLTSTLLQRMGCRVDVVGNGEEAIAAVQHLPYDLVLMDCDMPVMNGFDATRAIRAREGEGRHVPIIALTASALAGDPERCLAAGMDDFLAKPVRHQDLAQKVVEWASRAITK